MVRKLEILRIQKVLLNDRHRPLLDWVLLVPMVTWVLNSAYCER